MNLRNLNFYMVALLLCCSGCKSLQKTSASSKYSSDNNPKFADGIAIKPGQKNTDVIVRQSNNKQELKTGSYYLPDIEKADWLQIKYAILLDIPVEEVRDDRLLEVMDHWWGTHYCMGGNNESCIDCSGFTQVLMRDVFGLNIPRVASDQYKSSAHINEDKLKEGDLVFFRTSGRGISHVGVFLCNNKFVHASVSSGVMISSLNEDYWNKKYVAAGRYSN